MGQIHSHVVPGSVYNVNPRRLSVQEFQCFFNEGDQTCAAPFIRPISPTVLLNAAFDSVNDVSSESESASETKDNQVISVSKPDNRPLTFVLDPETKEMQIQVPYQPSLTLRFSLAVMLNSKDNEITRYPSNDSGSGSGSGTVRSMRLFFAHAGSAAELRQIITHRQVEVWTEVKEWVEPLQLRTEKLDFLFVWDAQEDREGGQPIHFAFFFDSDKCDSLENIAGGAVWVSERPNDELNLLYAHEQANCANSPNVVAPVPVQSMVQSVPGGLPDNLKSNLSQSLQSQQPSKGSGAAQVPATPGGATPSAATAAPVTPSTATPYRGGDAMMPYGVPRAPHQDPQVLLAPRPTSDHYFQPEDGPQFRSAIASMERKLPNLKARTKQLLKRSLMSRERLLAMIEADSWLASGIHEASRMEFASLKPIADWFSRNSEGGLSAIQRQRKFGLNELTTRIIEPLQQFYEYDIKGFEQRKREFEEESSQFYSWTSRYLAARKEVKRSKAAEQADFKFAAKKRSFDAARFDYFSYLSDITSGLKQQVLLQLLALAAQSITDSHIALGTELSNRTQPRLDEIVEDIKKAAREWDKFRVEKLNYRRSLLEEPESPNATNTSTTITTSTPSVPGSTATKAKTASIPVPSNNTNTFHTNKNTNNTFVTASSPPSASSYEQHQQYNQGSPELGPPFAEPVTNYKEGLLWASNRPGGLQDLPGASKQTSLQSLKWHKYWVVLDGISLREYSNWKQSVDLHNEPINLLVASVREARSNDRRFCFEIVTPQYKRVYQATSEDDMCAWIMSIRKSITTLLESTEDQAQEQSQQHHQRQYTQATQSQQQYQHQLPLQLPSSPPRHASSHHNDYELEISKRDPSSPSRRSGERIESLTRKLSLKSEKPRISPIITSMTSSNQQQIMGQPKIISTQSQGSNSNSLQTPLESKNSPFDEILYKVQCIPSNRNCAECLTTKSVEWVSINLLMVLCIECSGAHRSLGAHISKVRSLTLDTGAFTPSLKAALLSVSNEMMNSIWEAKMPQERKLTPEATSQSRVKFVTEKYVEKQYIQEVEKPNAALRRAISEQDVVKVCAALASRANPNGMSDDDEPMLIHALRSAQSTDVTFPTAEVLIKNGASVPPAGQYEGLSESAHNFLASKQSQP